MTSGSKQINPRSLGLACVVAHVGSNVLEAMKDSRCIDILYRGSFSGVSNHKVRRNVPVVHEEGFL